MSDLPKGLRKGHRIGVFTTEIIPATEAEPEKENTTLVWTDHKTINAAKRANRLTRYPIIRGKGE